MRMRCAKLVLGLAVGLAVPVTISARLAAGEAAADAKAGLEARLEKQIASIEDRMTSLQEEELNLSMKIMQARQKASEGVENPGKVAEQLAKGESGKGLRQYKIIMVSCARQLQAFGAKLQPLLKQVKALQPDREKAPEPLKARIDTVTARVESKYRANLEKVAQMYQQCAEFPAALGIYLSIYKSIPANQRAKEAVLIETIGESYDKAGDPKNALLFYKSLFEAKDPKSRYNDKKLGMKVAELYAKCGDKRSAVQLYQALFNALPTAKRTEKEGQELQKKIEEIEGKSGRSKDRDKKRY
ncbi:MAG TPA: hypothetical protein VM238_19430 [Phycisphaerae bacterium]|nr:hypothetical protein [Phycisphaerae bacterium]